MTSAREEPEGPQTEQHRDRRRAGTCGESSVDMDQAFRLLRDYARDTNQQLTDVARRFVDSPTADFPPPAHDQPRRQHRAQG